ncbi:hypothetical protein [Nocardia terpenica]|uniref:hypothetical protein n=1 Tax=Nocardia terpenica TaxID=455432 RepID=UPI0012FE224C|nr:hypothetical protein [Nocardia terpenica]
MRKVNEKGHLELMRDLIVIRKTRTATTDPAIRDQFDHDARKHEEEVRKRDRLGH